MQLLAFDFVFDNVVDDVARITALGENGDLLLAVGQVVRQVDSAVAVPHQGRRILGPGDKARLVHHGHGPLTKSDDHLHAAVL
ncbi:hypothetical protein DESC_770188 [Desulfosarcina cetonica]|nr:hypothetical protein DESC_770188 [Desulfosarcina cetonica]